ncbi:DUF3592 domain-containing protein [Spirosoma sp.]|uniref:DUF3592 domain-containing protein n=1 Tax=Spirosoma sp. TaxID=1899569 RepID=UPI003B3B1786
MEPKERLGLLFAGLFALVGTVFIIVAYMNWQSTQRIIKTGIETKGVVVDLRYGRDKKGRTTTAQAPVVEFTTSAGKSITYYSQTYTTPAGFAVGETVTLWYLPDDPQESITLEGTEIWILPAVFGGMGIVFSLIGYPLLIGSLRRVGKADRQPEGV